MTNNNTMTNEFRVFDEKYRYWDTTPLVVYPNTPIVKQGRIIQWYTGYKDKNGNKIFDGDIVKCYTDKQSSDRIIGVVVFNDYRKPAVITTTECCNDDDADYVKWFRALTEYGHYTFDLNKDVVIIGNIFDTPELLAKK